MNNSLESIVRARFMRKTSGLIVLLLAATSLLLLFLSLSVPARADSDFAIRTPFGSDGDQTEGVVAADINGDGALDLVVANPYGQSAVYLNDGAGNFPAGLLTCASAGVRCFGAPYTDTYPNWLIAATASVAVGDVNGDGALDIIAGNPGPQSAVYLNNGTGHFAYGASATCDKIGVSCFGSPSDNTTGVAAGDVNGDGRFDVVVANNGGQSVVFLNDGLGEFSSGAVTCGVTPNVRCFGGSNDPIYSVAVGDINGDGTLDIVAGSGLASDDIKRGGQMTGAQSAVYLNNGSGNFATALNCSNITAVRCFGSSSNKTTSVALGDMDGDGALDIVAGAVVFTATDKQSAVYLNSGMGNFATALDCGNTSVVRCFGDSAVSVAVGDQNGDGALDIVAGLYGQSAVYLNDSAGVFAYGYTSCGVTPHVRCFSGVLGSTTSVVLADVNGDSGLDIVAGNNQWNTGQNAIYLNETGGGDFATETACGVTPGVRCFGAGASFTWSAAVGDIDGDGDLDLVVGNQISQSAVYLNDGAGNFFTGSPDCANPTRVRCFGPPDDFDYPSLGVGPTVAVGDFNGDGALDIAVGSELSKKGVPSAVYLNDGAGHFAYGPTMTCATPGVRCFSPGVDTATDIAVGDMNGDGALDLIVTRAPYSGSDAAPSAVYLNDGAGNFYSGTVTCGVTPSVRCFGYLYDSAYSVAVGDFNRDGALDIVSGRFTGPSVIYFNDGNGNFVTTGYTGDCGNTPYLRCFGGMNYNAANIKTGDVNGDGALDIVMVSNGLPTAAYLNDGAGNFHVGLPSCGVAEDVRCFGPGSNQTYALAIGDLNGDGALDIVVGNIGAQNAAYLNDGAGNFYFGPVTCGVTGRVRCFSGINTASVAVGDINGDGALDIASANNGFESAVHLNGRGFAMRLVNNPPRVAMTAPNPLVNANFVYTNPTLRVPTIPITYSLSDPEGDPMRFIRAYYSPDGGGRWLPAVAASGTVTTNLSTSESGLTHTFSWNTFASGFFGQSDNVVFRLEAYTGLSPAIKGVPGPYQRPYASATTFPFRVRGTQVRVLSSTRPISNAIVYRLPAGQTLGALPIADSADRPFHTDNQGYLQGRGQLNLGDRLVALYPITSTGPYTLYFTSAAPTPTSLNAFTVTTPGVQTLMVSPNNPLILFNLDVSLEWDARLDTQFMSQLQYDLQRVSELLYDWSNGQAALGHVTIYHNRQHWWTSDVQIYATNRLRPYASVGGSVTSVMTEVITPPASTSQVITYTPGRVHIGAVWNHFGATIGTPGQDWPRALAHELGHYLFFQNDDYLGLQNGLITSLDSCTGTVMTDPYRDDYSEFHPDAGWAAQCSGTLAQQTTGRSDWATIKKFYPWLDKNLSNDGPTSLSLAVTQINQVMPTAPSVVLPVPIFNLTQNGSRVQPGTSAQAFLYQGDRLIDLGGPSQDKVIARGAKVGDRLCVYELAANRLGCETVQAGNTQLDLMSRPDWRPEVIVTPINSTTVSLKVKGLSTSLSLKARLYPIGALASPTLTLFAAQVPAVSSAPAIDDIAATSSYSYTVFLPLVMKQSGSGLTAYVGTFNLAIPALEAYVQVWVDEPDPRREIITSYALGGNPAPEAEIGYSPEGDIGYAPEADIGYAPGSSSDGQVILFGGASFPLGEFTTLQAATALPSAPPGRTIVGQGYWLSTSSRAPSLSGNGFSINFRYLQGQVPAGEEAYLKIYRWDGTQWSALPTQLDLLRHYAFAPTQGPGLYVLMSSVDIQLFGPGWNQFGYPVQGSRAVTQALLSISGYYTTVYGLVLTDTVDVLTDTVDPWKVYDVTAPDWVNDLKTLDFGHTYWINVSKPITLQVTGGGASALASVENLPSPPMTFYGPIITSANFTPISGSLVTAWIGGKQCGAGKAQTIDGQLMYTLNVIPDGPGGWIGCGAPGRSVTFTVDGQPAAGQVAWNIDRVWYLPLQSSNQTTLPDLVVRSIQAQGNQVQVVIANQGTAPVRDEFWIDLYVDPNPVPTGVNQIWNDGRSTYGAVWSVPNSALPQLGVGGTLTLTLGDAYYWPTISHWPALLPLGTPLYAQVDSANANTTYGAVLESHEAANGPYNNISHIIVSRTVYPAVPNSTTLERSLLDQAPRP